MFLTFETQSTASSCNIITDKTLILFLRIRLVGRNLHYSQTTAGQTWCSLLVSWHCLEGSFEKGLWIPSVSASSLENILHPDEGTWNPLSLFQKPHETPSQQAGSQGKLLHNSETEPEAFWRHPWVTRLALTVSCSIKTRKVINK